MAEPDAQQEAKADRPHEIRSVDEMGEHWVVLQDPEGNEFCVS